MSAYDYDLIVIGGGAAGFVSSKLAAGLGKRVALIEKERLGGECTLYGCVPSKSLIKAGNILRLDRATGQDKQAATNGNAPLTRANVMAHVGSVVAKVYAGHTPELFERLGIEVLFASPQFLDNHTIAVDGKKLSAKAFMVATGSSAFVPPIEGLDRVSYLTNRSFFALKTLPDSMIILGGGPIGTELAQALNRCGVEVTIVEMGNEILSREDVEMRPLVTSRLIADGVKILTQTRAVLVTQNGSKTLTIADETGKESTITANEILVAVGRKANVDGLDLEKAGVEYSPKAIKTDRRLSTTAPNIYACGDVTGPYQFSHMAEYQARIATTNALFPLKRAARYDHYAWCMFTTPELAHAGLTEEEARKTGDIRIYRRYYRDTDRGKTDLEESGLAKFICDRNYRILGAHIYGPNAADVLHEAQLAKSLGIPFHRLDSVIHIYPTFSDVLKQPAKECHIDRLKSSILGRIAGAWRGHGKRGKSWLRGEEVS